MTIQSKGDTQNFGELTQARSNIGALSSTTRGVGMGGMTPTDVNTIDYITIPTLGNAIDFGDLTKTGGKGGPMSNSIRGCLAGRQGGSNRNVIDYITIASTGNATDFGDVSYAARNIAGWSDSHGGLG